MTARFPLMVEVQYAPKRFASRAGHPARILREIEA
jgi:hypothetical protein